MTCDHWILKLTTFLPSELSQLPPTVKGHKNECQFMHINLGLPPGPFLSHIGMEAEERAAWSVELTLLQGKLVASAAVIS